MKTRFLHTPHLITGERGESEALSYVQKQLRRKIVKTNWTCSLGEIDIIACDKSTLFFIEVKTRKASHSKAYPIIEAVDWRKQKKIILLSKAFLTSSWRYRNYSVRYEVICVEYQTEYTECQITHYPDAWRDD